MTRHIWTPAEIDTLRRLYPTEPAQAIADAMGLSIKQVYSKAASLGLRKPGDWIAERTRRILANPNHPARKTQFKAGLVPWNKGKPHPTTGRAAEHQFRPGNVPHTWQPIGHTRTNADGYLERKTADTGVTRHDYVLIHRLIWRWHGGTVPPGHALVFKDGDKTNLDINNLELITRQELMRRNTLHRYPKEIARLIQLRGAVTRQINNRTRTTA